MPIYCHCNNINSEKVDQALADPEVQEKLKMPKIRLNVLSKVGCVFAKACAIADKEDGKTRKGKFSKRAQCNDACKISIGEHLAKRGA